MKKLYSSILVASAAFLMAPAADASLYFIGQPQGWDIEDGSWPLTETSSGVYEATYNIPAGQFMFRFYTELGNWDAGSIGAGEGDVDITIELTDDTWYTGFYVDGKGNWNYPQWQGGDVYMTVNMNAKTVVFTSDPDAEIPTPMPDMYIRGANINGQSGWDAINKMTYNYSDGVYTWTGTELGNEFKFSDDPGWNGQYNIGSNGSPLEEGVEYKYNNSGSSSNITFANTATVISNPNVVLNINKGTVLITGKAAEQEITLTIAGTFNDWIANDPDYSLTKNSEGKYEGTFYMFPDSAFQVVLLGANWYGYANGDGEIAFGDKESVTMDLGTGYQNDFLLTDWDGGDLTFIVTVENNTPKTVTLSKDNAGVELLLDDAKGNNRIFNLQGVEVNKDNLGKGIYIINGKKVAVK